MNLVTHVRGFDRDLSEYLSVFMRDLSGHCSCHHGCSIDENESGLE